MTAPWETLPDGLRHPQAGQVLTTAAELHAVPEYAVIVGVGDEWENEHSDTDPTVFQKWDFGTWHSPMYPDSHTAEQLIQGRYLPKRYLVVWVPPVAVR